MFQVGFNQEDFIMLNSRLSQKSVRALHRENMLRTLFQRMKVANTKGDLVLIRQLESERKELGL